MFEEVGSLMVMASDYERRVSFRWAERDRLWWVTAIGLVGLVLAVALAVLGLPPVDLHGPLHRYGIMDPLCGGTRAARLTAQGDLGEAWRYNPLGILATFAAVAAAVRLVVGVATKRWLDVTVAWTPRLRWAMWGMALVLLVLLEIRQQGRAELLMRPY